MRKSKILTLLLSVLLGCTDVVELKKTDVMKYPWLTPFILQAENISGSHNLDVGTMSFKYKYDRTYTQMKGEINKVIIENDWKLTSVKSNTWEIKKRIAINESLYEQTEMKIQLDSVKSIAIFEIHWYRLINYGL